MRTLAGEGAGHVPADPVDAGARLALVNVWKTEKQSDTETVFVCLDKADMENCGSSTENPRQRQRFRLALQK